MPQVPHHCRRAQANFRGEDGFIYNMLLHMKLLVNALFEHVAFFLRINSKAKAPKGESADYDL